MVVLAFTTAPAPMGPWVGDIPVVAPSRHLGESCLDRIWVLVGAIAALSDKGVRIPPRAALRQSQPERGKGNFHSLQADGRVAGDHKPARGLLTMPEIVIIGAGISGAAAACRLARAGHDVLLLDRYAPAAMASGWTLAGVRCSGRHPAELPLAQAAVTEWQTLHEDLGADLFYRREGNLRLARTPDELAVIRDMVADQTAAGLELSFIEGKDVQEIAPAVSPSVLAASWCPGDGHADPHASVAAFIEAAVRAGAQTSWGEEVTSLDVEHGRITGVTTTTRSIPCERVILAAGVFADKLLAPLGLSLPYLLRVVTVVRSEPLPERILAPVIGVANADCAGRQEIGGQWRASTGVGPWDGNYDDSAGKPEIRPTLASVRDVIDRFGTVIPAFSSARIQSVWTGIIDTTPDALPVLDTPQAVEGLVVGAGFSGHGFCLGPVTGRILAALATGDPVDHDLAPFRLARFEGWNGRAEALTLHG